MAYYIHGMACFEQKEITKCSINVSRELMRLNEDAKKNYMKSHGTSVIKTLMKFALNKIEGEMMV